MDLIMKIFYLNRAEDESGISGTGRVAQGFVFDNGKVAMTWLSEHPTVTIYDNIVKFTQYMVMVERRKLSWNQIIRKHLVK